MDTYTHTYLHTYNTHIFSFAIWWNYKNTLWTEKLENTSQCFLQHQRKSAAGKKTKKNAHTIKRSSIKTNVQKNRGFCCFCFSNNNVTPETRHVASYNSPRCVWAWTLQCEEKCALLRRQKWLRLLCLCEWTTRAAPLTLGSVFWQGLITASLKKMGAVQGQTNVLHRDNYQFWFLEQNI